MRTTLPRLRYDQLMRFGWKVLLPIATLNAVITAILVVAIVRVRDDERRRDAASMLLHAPQARPIA